MPDENENTQSQETQTESGGNNNMADSTYLERKLVSQENSPIRDELIQGEPKTSVIKITQAGNYKRGLLMMEGTNNEFVPATAAGINQKKFCMILADNVELASGEYTEIAAYYHGRFKASSVILAYESESDSHDELINAISPVLIKQDIVFC